jgi:hypothetical protein
VFFGDPSPLLSDGSSRQLHFLCSEIASDYTICVVTVDIWLNRVQCNFTKSVVDPVLLHFLWRGSTCCFGIPCATLQICTCFVKFDTHLSRYTESVSTFMENICNCGANSVTWIVNQTDHAGWQSSWVAVPLSTWSARKVDNVSLCHWPAICIGRIGYDV